MLSWAPLLPQATLLDNYLRANTGGKIIVIVLFLGSVAGWSIMVTKFMEFRRALRESQEFLQAYRSETPPLALILKRPTFPGSPLCTLFRAACRSLHALVAAQGLNPAEWFGSPPREAGARLSSIDLTATRHVLEQTIDEQVVALEKNIVVLATAVTAAPFLGLLGTVWGVMDAFSGLGVQGSATISSVAPGIAGSLITTFVGLIVALPSLIGYNMLTSRVRILNTMMEHFSDELMTELERYAAR